MNSQNGTSCVVYSIPRAGTHAVMNVMRVIGLKEFTPKNGIGIYNINTMPSKGHFEYGGHFTPDMEPIAAMRLRGYRGVFISRDLRDVVVSHAHMGIVDAKKQGKHPLYPVFNMGNLNKAISWLMEYEVHRYLVRIGWRMIPGVYSTTYERLWLQTKTEIANMATHLGIQLTDEQINKCVIDFAPTNKENPYKFYYRQGSVGDWKNYFTEEHKKEFKKIAGHILIKEGYEKDMEW